MKSHIKDTNIITISTINSFKGPSLDDIFIEVSKLMSIPIYINKLIKRDIASLNMTEKIIIVEPNIGQIDALAKLKKSILSSS